MENLIKELITTDPELAEWIALQETAFAKTFAEGYLALNQECKVPLLISTYCRLVQEAGKEGPTLGRIMATYLVPVLKHGSNGFLEEFLHTVGIMLKKGAYTLKTPLDALSMLLNSGDVESGSAYLDLLCEAFSQYLTYNQSLHLSHSLPSAVIAFSPSRRTWQIEQFRRIVNKDALLTEPFLQGMEKGLNLLSKDALSRFVALGLEKIQHNEKLGVKFLSLESKLGIDIYTDMQVTVPLSQIQHQLNRCLQARIGMAMGVRSQGTNEKTPLTSHPSVYSDGKFIYLPDEISLFDSKEENIHLYKCLTKLEAAYYEFHTFDFDLEKAMERSARSPCINRSARSPCINRSTRSPCINRSARSPCTNRSARSPCISDLPPATCNQHDLELFFDLFPIKELASDLFTIFEHGRIRILLTQMYPGLVRQAYPLLQQEAMRISDEEENPLFLLYAWIGLGIPFSSLPPEIGTTNLSELLNISELFEKRIREDNRVETCAELVSMTYDRFVQGDLALRSKNTIFALRNLQGDLALRNLQGDLALRTYVPLKIPFDRRLRPDLFFATYQNFERMAKQIKIKIEEKGAKIYQSDIRKHLMENHGEISIEAIKSLTVSDSDATLSAEAIKEILGNTDIPSLDILTSHSGDVFWYKEWDCHLADYLHDHVRVLDKVVSSVKGDFYEFTLEQYRGLVKQIRHAFELLKPEGLTILRQWVEGDEFDYRAMLDFAMDKKAGIMPSDRLYIKRVKQQRDVAVMLLVDLSRSTANPVAPSGSAKIQFLHSGGQSHALSPKKETTVLDVEKEAIVLFCEALQVVGDAFAIAGFSGTGRLGVDYFRIKDFDEIMDDTIKERINAIAPQRSTRMGAAIRHAVAQFENVSARVRILIVLGDGFPNDTDYKQEYAIEDTRKAISEAFSKNIYARAITVNIVGDAKLDTLYGQLHHNVISDVRELPDKLLRIYSSLTR